MSVSVSVSVSLCQSVCVSLCLCLCLCVCVCQLVLATFSLTCIHPSAPLPLLSLLFLLPGQYAHARRCFTACLRLLSQREAPGQRQIRRRHGEGADMPHFDSSLGVRRGRGGGGGGGAGGLQGEEDARVDAINASDPSPPSLPPHPSPPSITPASRARIMECCASNLAVLDGRGGGGGHIH